MQALCAAPLASGVAAGAAPSPVDGAWTYEYPCDRDQGGALERCRAGARDVFDLFLRAKDGRVCGGYVVTIQLSGRVDEDDLSHWTFVRRADGQSYRVRFQAQGLRGEALLRRVGDHLAWTTTAEEPTSLGDWPFRFGPPRTADLRPSPARGTIHCPASRGDQSGLH